MLIINILLILLFFIILFYDRTIIEGQSHNYTLNDLYNTDSLLNRIGDKYQIYAYTYSHGKLSIVINECSEDFGDIEDFVELQKNKKIISIIGNFMTGKVGFASKIFGIISDINVNLDDICQTHNNNHM